MLEKEVFSTPSFSLQCSQARLKKSWVIINSCTACHPITALFFQLICHENSKQNCERCLALTASRVAENRQIRESTEEIFRSEFRSKNNTGHQKLIYHGKLYHSTFYMPRIGSFGPFIRIKYKLELNHVIRVATNKHVFGETQFTYLSVTLTCSHYTVKNL